MQTSTSRDSQKAFTLVEMAIVLVIIGLLVGAVFAGQSLLRNSQVTQVLTDAKTYATAIQQFKDKYAYLPGDFPEATRVWGRLKATADCVTNSSASLDATGGVCDGDGNGIMNGVASAAGASSESFQLWRQLQLAGFITGSFTGLNGPLNTNYDTIPKTNVPSGAIANTGFWHYSWGYSPASTTFYEGNYDNTLAYGGRVANDWIHGPALYGKEAFALDTKVDDGLPPTGTIRTLAQSWQLGVNGVSCTSSDTAASATYTKGDTSPTCFLLFMNNFQVSSQQGTFTQP
ncbi:MAG: type II secretion system protein [Rickettsiales bacterium]